MITVRALLAALTNAVRGWRPIHTFRGGPGRRVDLWLEVPPATPGKGSVWGFRVCNAWRSGDGEWRHDSGTPLRADFITHWREIPPAPRKETR